MGNHRRRSGVGFPRGLRGAAGCSVISPGSLGYCSIFGDATFLNVKFLSHLGLFLRMRCCSLCPLQSRAPVLMAKFLPVLADAIPLQVFLGYVAVYGVHPSLDRLPTFAPVDR